MNILEKLTELISNYKEQDVALTPEMTFDDLDLDSLDVLDLVTLAEDVFDISFGDEVNATNVGELIAEIENLQNKQNKNKK